MVSDSSKNVPNMASEDHQKIIAKNYQKYEIVQNL